MRRPASTTIGNASIAAITAIRVERPRRARRHRHAPEQLAGARLAKDTAGQYLGGGPMVGAYGNNGLMPARRRGDCRWRSRRAIAAEHGARRGVRDDGPGVLPRRADRRGVATATRDFFQKNLTAIRAERRLALAVYRPQAFHSITALQTP